MDVLKLLRKALVMFITAGAWLCGMTVLVLISPTAHAATLFSGWFYTAVTGPAPGENVLVAEGILYDTVPGTAGAPTYDYQFYVANTGIAPLAAFGGGTGPPGAVLYNSDISFGLPGLPASGPVNAAGPLPAFLTQVPPAQPSNRLPGGWGGANNPFLGTAAVTPYTPLFPGVKGLISPNYKYWGFEVSSAGGAGAPYALGWYNLVGNQIFGHGLVTRFDLDSIFGPVPGGAFIDSGPASTYLLDWVNGDTVSLATPAIADPSTNFCDPTTDPTCSADIIPPNIAALNYTGLGAVPVPPALPLFATGLVGLGLLGWRRKRKAGS